MDVAKGRTIGRYVLEERLGRGGMGEVWKAVDPQLRRPVAIKLLLHDERDDVARFRREAETVAGLTHPNIAALYEFGEADGRPFIAMQFIDGAPAAPGKLAPRAAAETVRAAAEAVAFAHSRGVVHRDLKPANLMIDAAKRVFVMDFGLAKSVRDASLSASGMMIGTPSFMSPEQAMGRTRDIGPRSDVYGLGATLHALLAGAPPFDGETLVSLLARVIESDPPRLPPSVPRDLSTIALKAMEKDPDRRYAGAREMADDLGRFLAGEPIAARPASITYRLGRRIRKHPVVFGLTILTTIAATVAVMTVLRLGRERRDAMEMLRVTASSQLQAALKLRRAGQNEALPDLLPPLEKAYALAAERAPEDPEVDYLLGRMHRALLDEEKALACQAAALKKDPNYAPALYEWIVLKASRYRARLEWAVQRVGFDRPDAGIEALEERVPELRRDRREILEVLEQFVRSSERAGAGVTGAHVLAARGILMRHTRQYDDARALLTQAVERDRLLEEAWVHLALVSRDQALVTPLGPRRDELWRQADETFGRAIEIDRGFAAHWLSRGSARLMRLLAGNGARSATEEDLRAMEGDYSEAVRLEPKSGQARLERGHVRSLLAAGCVDSGGDPRALLDAAEADLAAAIERLPESVLAFTRRAEVRQIRGVYAMETGVDPAPHFASALADTDRALAMNPHEQQSLVLRGWIRVNAGVWRKRGGGDPTPEYDAAEPDLVRAQGSGSYGALAALYLGTLHANRATWRAEKGGDPLPEWDKATACFAASLAMWHHYDTLVRRGTVYTNRGLHLDRAGRGDPKADFAAAERDFNDAVLLAPHQALAWSRRATMRANRALCIAKSGDPTPDWAGAEADYGEALKRRANDAVSMMGRGDVRWNRGRHRGARGDVAGARRDFAGAADDFEAAMKANPALKGSLEGAAAEARRLSR